MDALLSIVRNINIEEIFSVHRNWKKLINVHITVVLTFAHGFSLRNYNLE